MTNLIGKLSKRDYQRAQLLYFGHKEVSEICTVLSIDAETVRFYIFGEDGNGTDPTSWMAIRKKLNPTAMALYLKDKVGVLEQTAGIGLEILNKSLGDLRDAVNNDEAKLTVDDMAKLAKIVVDMDKMVRLESGMATDIIDHMGLSIAEAREIMANDPFAQAVQVEYTELPWLSDEQE